MASRIRLARIAFVIALTAGGGAPRGAPGLAPDAGKVVSPSGVLARSDRGAGTEQIYMANQQGDETERGADHTLAPYLFVAGGDPAVDRLPLESTSADVQIAGVIARVNVHQVFQNRGGKPIEAIYVFPGSTRAAVHGMRMRIGQRSVEAHIDRRQAAREDYEAARREGRRASLLEQERPNVFTMSVANIMPRDRIEVELDYSEMLVPEDGVYELVYPSVVGPRYGGGADPQADRWIASPTLAEGRAEPYRFDVHAHLETGIALKEVSSPSHKVAVTYAAPGSADVRLQEAGGGNRDFVLRYRLAGDRIETGLLLWKEPAAQGREAEGFFALMMEPPQRPRDADVPPREYVFLLDVSGSMHGFPLETAKTLMRTLLGRLRATDTFNLSLFSGASYVMSPEGSVPATAANVKRAAELVERQDGGGGTELMGGLRACYGIPRHDPGVSRTVVVVTDGYVGVEAQAFRFIRERLDQANLFAFGIGSAVNRALIEGMARAGQGEPFVVLRPEKAAEAAARFGRYIEQPVLTRIAVDMKGFAGYEVSPAKVPDLMARRPLVVFGKYHGEPTGSIEVSGLGGGGRRWLQTVAAQAGGEKAANAPLRFLWARRWVETLEDERHLRASPELEKGITGIGLQYGLLTAFTSFVAVDTQVANRTGQATPVAQPLPLPEGVTNQALGGLLGNHAVGRKGQGYGSGAGGLGVGGTAYGIFDQGALAGAAKKSASPRAAAPATVALAEPRQDGAATDATGTKAAASAKAPEAPRRTVGRPKPQSLTEARPGVAAVDARLRPKARGLTAAQPLVAAVDARLHPSARRLTDAQPLAAAIEARLRANAPGCGLSAGAVKLRLTVDRAGKVVKVAVVAAGGGGKAAACIEAALVGLTTATHAVGAATGTLELTIPPPSPDR